MDSKESLINRCRLQAILNEFEFNNTHYSNTEELASFLDARGVIVPPCEVGAKVWAYAPIGGLCECRVLEVAYYFSRENSWSIYCSSSSGLSFSVNRVYSSREEALRCVKQ